jgi:hypothetical protein
MKAMSLVAFGLSLLALARAAGAARTPPPVDHGAEVALRTGVAIPTGSISDGTELGSYVSNAVPLILEGGYRVDPSLFVGARFQYAFPSIKSPTAGVTCGGNTDCSGSDVQLGIEGIYRFLADQRFAPWVGLAFGYEWASADYTLTNVGMNVGAGGTNRGLVGAAQAGGDVRVTSQLVLGPFIEATVGRYDTAETRMHAGNRTTETTADITNTAAHTWITIGVRGAFGF